MDLAAFYSDPANAEALEHRAKIEEVIAAQAKKGITVGRVDAWKWLRGGELYEPLQKKRDDNRIAKENEAAYAMGAGGGIQHQRQTGKPIDEQTTDELSATLKGVAF